MASSSPSSRSVLVVDDDELMRELLTALLEAEGHSVTVAGTQAQALALLKNATSPPDVVLTDMRMSGEDTAEFLRKLNTARPPGTLLLGMSASSPRDDEEQLLDIFLLKPFGACEFNTAVTTAEHTRAGEIAAVRSTPTGTKPAGLQTEVLDQPTYQKLAAALPAAALRELYTLTITDALARVDSMRAAAGDPDTCRREAHAIKGAAGMVGAAELRSLTAAIEAGAPADTPALDEIAAACDRLGRMLDALP